ncbi:hypothetical protein B0H66DRAFT_542577 [Apodospora peruviana]|uniref:Uncharacterized protein n=1 Tax=Apodospora peruviana TaxID=516989 RepID=A0AAE0IS40_9PEZI|nr:hypothetical protein B0H66DRAFT_542577 [Apodospora peruviana]
MEAVCHILSLLVYIACKLCLAIFFQLVYWNEVLKIVLCLMWLVVFMYNVDQAYCQSAKGDGISHGGGDMLGPIFRTTA